MPSCYDPPMKIHKFCSPCCQTQCCTCPGPTPALLSFLKLDAASGTGIPGAGFELRRNGLTISTAYSDAAGIVRFPLLVPGVYTLLETVPPAGYQPQSRSYVVTVSTNGAIDVDGVPLSQFRVVNTPTGGGASFSLVKYDVLSGARLGGAGFELLSGAVVIGSATSGADGTFGFSGLEPGTYTLAETTPPAGYEPVTGTHTVVVAPDGSVTVDGIPARFASIGNTPSGFEISFRKADSVSGAPLGGAVFELLSGTSVIATAASDVFGNVAFGGRAPGVYTIRETTPPIGYQLNPATYTAVVSADGSVTIDGVPAEAVTIPNTPAVANTIAFRIVDAESGAPLGGAVYELFSGDTAIANATSLVNGLVDFGTQPAGAYTIRQQTPPAGYLPDTTVHTAVVNADGSVTVDGVPAADFVVRSTKTPSVTIIKNNQTGAPLSGAVFQLSQNGTIVATVTTGADGSALLDGLAPGAYTLTEVTPPAGYQPDATVHTVTVGAGGSVTIDGVVNSTLTVTNLPVLFDVSFNKIDGATGAPLGGADFQLLDGGTAVVSSATSDAAGRVALRVPLAGTYTIRELTPPLGYLPNPNLYTAVVDSTGNVTIDGTPAAAFTVPNTPITGLQVRKINTAGEPLAGAELQLRQGDATVLTQTTGMDGLASFTTLAAGTYTLVETVSPSGYQQSAVTYSVVVSDTGITVNGIPQTGALPIANIPLQYNVFFRKLDGETGGPVNGAVFSLSSGDTVLATATSDASGSVNFGSLSAGNYTVRETTPAPGYQLSDELHTVVVTADGMVTVDGAPPDTAVVNNTVAYQVQVNKVNSQGVPIYGAQFQMLSGATPLQAASTNPQGIAYFRGLAAGTYTLVESAAAPGYESNSTAYTVVIGADGTVTIDGAATNQIFVTDATLPFYTMFVKRNGETGRPLGGATFRISNDAFAATVISSPVSGAVDFAEIPEGTYTLVEAGAPAGFIPNPQTYTVAVSGTGVVTVDGSPVEGFSIDNYPLSLLSVELRGASGNPVPGAQYQLSQNGAVLQTLVTDARGNANFSALSPGTYSLAQSAQAPGYQADNAPHTVVVDDRGAVSIDGAQGGTLRSATEAVANVLFFSKTDARTGAPVAQAQFTLEPGAAQATSDVNGRVYFGDLPEGAYTLTETVTPPGYAADTAVHAVAVDAAGIVTIDGAALEAAVIQNQPMLYPFTVEKVDASTGAPLPGAVFQLEAVASGTVFTETSGADGLAQFHTGVGNYRLRELTPPANYLPSGAVAIVTISSGAQVLVNNTPLAGNYTVADISLV